MYIETLKKEELVRNPAETKHNRIPWHGSG
jgi:hypothetical protein